MGRTVTSRPGVGRGGKRHLNNQSPMTGRNIMSAILQTKGPAVIPQVIKNVWKFLHMMTTDQFVRACPIWRYSS